MSSIRSNREAMLRVLRTVESAKPETLADFRAAVANHKPAEDVPILMESSLFDVLVCLRVTDLLDFAERAQ
jgi:hypothetical protein